MSRYRPRRCVAIVTRATRAHSARLSSRADRTEPRAIPAADVAALAFLGEVLAGDGEWTIGEVRRLIALRDGTPAARRDGTPHGPRDGAEPELGWSGGA